MKYDDEIEAGIETDTFIHLRVFDRNDDAPPYSTDQKTAEWLADHYCLSVQPLHVLRSGTPRDGITEEMLGEAVGYTALARMTIITPEGEKTTDDYMLSSAPTFPLCVARSALLLNKLVETGWNKRKPDDPDPLPPGI